MIQVIILKVPLKKSKTLFIALILVTVIIYLFLGNVGFDYTGDSFTSFFNFNFSINLLFDFSINLFCSCMWYCGIVVDDAIVMFENITRKIELEKTLVAAFKGAKQVSFAIIATTVVLVAVFIP